MCVCVWCVCVCVAKLAQLCSANRIMQEKVLNHSTCPSQTDLQVHWQVGSFIGSSAITTAKVLKSMRLNTGVVCLGARP